jgi:hypothetical protein
MAGQTWAILVAYGWSPRLESQWRNFLREWCLPSNALVVQNDPNAPDCSGFQTVRGSNAHAEFSGYLEGYKALADHHMGQLPLLVVNDTLFSHRWTSGWRRAVRLWAHRPPPALLGDTRLDRIPGTPVEMAYLSSWIFGIHGVEAHAAFLAGLETVVQPEHWGTPAYEMPEYRGMVQGYLDGRNGRGWSQAGRATSEVRSLKEKCIYAEHRLGGIWMGKVRPSDADSRLETDVNVYQGLEGVPKRLDVDFEGQNLAGKWRWAIRVFDRGFSAKRRYLGMFKGVMGDSWGRFGSNDRV